MEEPKDQDIFDDVDLLDQLSNVSVQDHSVEADSSRLVDQVTSSSPMSSDFIDHVDMENVEENIESVMQNDNIVCCEAEESKELATEADIPGVDDGGNGICLVVTELGGVSEISDGTNYCHEENYTFDVLQHVENCLDIGRPDSCQAKTLCKDLEVNTDQISPENAAAKSVAVKSDGISETADHSVHDDVTLQHIGKDISESQLEVETQSFSRSWKGDKVSQLLEDFEQDLSAPAILCFESTDEHVHLSARCEELERRVRDMAKVVKELEFERDELREKCQSSTTDSSDSSPTTDVDVYHAQITELESRLQQHQAQWKLAHEKWVAQDTVIKNTIAQLSRANEECRRDKDSMVIKYAQAEQKNIELNDRLQKLETSLRDCLSEKETLQTYLTAQRSDKQKLKELMDKRASEVVALKVEADKHKELLAAHELKTKWYQNQLHVESESHKVTQGRVGELERQINELKDVNERLKRESQAAVKTYQESMVMKTITKELELKETKQTLETHKLEHSEQQELFTCVKSELETLKMKEKELIEELNTYKDKVKCLDDERIFQEQTLAKFRETLQCQKIENMELSTRLAELETVEKQLEELKSQASELRLTHVDMLTEVAASRDREAHHLHCINRLSEQTAKLQAENTELSAQVAQLTNQVALLTARCTLLDDTLAKREKELMGTVESQSQTLQDLRTMHTEQTQLAEERKKLYEDKDDELKTLKRRHAASTKELMRQIAQLQKRVEGSSGGHKVASRASPCSEASESESGSSTVCGPGSMTGLSGTMAHEVDETSFSNVQVDKHRLIKKIVDLQSLNATLTNKLEFMQEHTNQLMNELHNKSKIIQDYVLREETSYTLRPSSVSQPGGKKVSGVLTSVLQSGLNGLKISTSSAGATSPQSPSGDTRDVEDRLQCALEDMLLKNVQYKENADHLTEELARLSQTNNKLRRQLELVKSTPTSFRSEH